VNIGNRIRQARVAAGLSVRDVAKTVGVSRNAIYRYERGEIMPRASVLVGLAGAFGVDIEFFFRRTQVELCASAYRKRSRLGKKQQESIEARITSGLETYLSVEDLFPERIGAEFHVDLGAIKSVSDAESAADRLRDLWDLGSDPIDSVIFALEEHGVKVVVLDKVEGFDGFSCYANHTIPVIAIPAGMAGDRQRFTLAHELGHLVLYGSDQRDIEKAAHRFAGAFLAPAKVVIGELGEKRSRLDLTELHILKQTYGMSMQAWVRRAYDLGIISGSYYKALCRTFGSRGWRKEEPGQPLPEEKPVRMLLLVHRAVAEGLLTPTAAEEILEHKRMPEVEINEEALAMRAAEAAALYRSSDEVTEWTKLDQEEFLEYDQMDAD